MNTTENQYLQALRDACQEIKLDYFPQVEASELLYKVITLEDIYLPLTMETLGDQRGKNQLDIDALIERIDRKIAELEAREAGESIFSEQADTDDSFAAEPAEEPRETGLRLSLKAKPGRGKTTFCKRLALALVNRDDAFFLKYASENDLHFRPGSFPVLLNCKNIAELTTAQLREISFPELAYQLCSLGMGNHFTGIEEADFTALLQKKAKAGLTLILDGWDEILDTEKEEAFRDQLNTFLSAVPLADLVLTIRLAYVEPPLVQPYSHRYNIKELSDADTREFCRKWCQTVLSPASQKKYDHSLIAERIIRSADPQIRLLRKNPLDLSLLLIISKNYGRLPDNKAELFKELVELYIFWSTTKSSAVLSAKSIRIFLAYIACYFTKHKKLYCYYEELTDIIRQCIRDLEWTFSEDVTQISTHDILQELSRSNILTLAFDKRYSFSESTTIRSHRQMQEYLTAYAIVAQYADEEYNNQPPIAIFEGKYGDQKWREVIMFIALMGNGRLRQEIVKQLIAKAQAAEEDYHYTNLLFELIVNGAGIHLADMHTIYDLLFAEHITDRQISDIYQLVSGESRVSADFIHYIEERFRESVQNGGNQYSYARAIIASAQAVQQGCSPFDLVTTLLTAQSSKENILTGIFILLVLAWCKYENIANVFKPYYARYKMPPVLIHSISQLLCAGICKTDLLKAIKEAILANFASFSHFFRLDNLDSYYTQIQQQENPVDAQIILSLAPVFDPTFPVCQTTPASIKRKYLQQLKEEHEGLKYNSLIFTFSICAALGCWEEDELERVWSSLDPVYAVADTKSGSMGKIRYAQLKTIWEQTHKTDDFTMWGADPVPFPEVWILAEQTEQQFIYRKGSEALRIRCGSKPLSEEGADFLGMVTIPDVPISKNNLAYLLRRQELESVELTANGQTTMLTPEKLLEKGADAQEPYSLVNKALAMFNIHHDTVADAALGELMLSIPLLSPFTRQNRAWPGVISWWMTLACEREELEGLVVISWLFDLEMFQPADYTSDTLQSLLSLTDKAASVGLTIQDALFAAIRNVLAERTA